MLKSILIGLDGSGFSDSAVALGLRWAKAFDTRLAGLAIVDEPGIMALEPVPLGAAYFSSERDAKALAEARAKATRLVDAFAARCLLQGAKSQGMQAAGDPPEVILKEAQRHDLILLGVDTFYRYEAQGSPCNTLDHVLHAPTRPVIAVPEKMSDGETVVIGYDGSRQAAQTLAAYRATGLAHHFENVVVTIDEHYEEAERLARYASDYLALHGAKVKVRAIETRVDPGPILLEHTDQMKAQLLVMGAFGHSMLREFVFGSTTRTVLRSCKVPVMLFH